MKSKKIPGTEIEVILVSESDIDQPSYSQLLICGGMATGRFITMEGLSDQWKALLKNGPGDKILMTEKAFVTLPTDELDALVLHEVSHVELGHTKDTANHEGAGILIIPKCELDADDHAVKLGANKRSLSYAILSGLRIAAETLASIDPVKSIDEWLEELKNDGLIKRRIARLAQG